MNPILSKQNLCLEYESNRVPSVFEISGILLFLREIDHYSISSEKSTKMAAASTTAMNTNKSENNAEEDSDEVIYDLTTDFRAASRALGEIYI